MIDILVLNIIVLFGAVQGFTLCVYLSTQKHENVVAFRYYLLFLFSLSYYNLSYALLYWGVYSIGPVPLGSFPFPYKHLIGLGLYFYIKSLIVEREEVFSKKEYLLFLPAIGYGLLRLYWYITMHTGIDRNIFKRVYDSGFFIYHDFAYLLYSFVLMILALRFLKRNRAFIKGSVNIRKNWDWLSKFIYAFLLITVLNLLHQIIANLFGLQHSQLFYYIILILNSIYIYWIGFIGFTKSNLLFRKFQLVSTALSAPDEYNLKHELDQLMMQEVFSQPKIKVADLASMLQITEKELSTYIHETYDLSFTEFINWYRIEKVKKLLQSGAEEQFTLVAIGQQAGFSSKSSFNAVFKKMTGQTPTEYRKSFA